MRRHAYPFGRYLVRDRKIEDVAPHLKKYVDELGFPVVKYDTDNEGMGTLIVAVNKKRLDLFFQTKPPGRIEMLLAGFSLNTPSFREMDLDSQRVGIELYLWPFETGILVEIFTIPYMELLNRPEIYGLTESRDEEITDWYLCEHIWEEIVPRIEKKFDLEPVHRRA